LPLGGTAATGAAVHPAASLTPHRRRLAQIAFYQARAGAGGTDHFVYDVRNSNGEGASTYAAISIKSPAEQGARGESALQVTLRLFDLGSLAKLGGVTRRM
jgi:hypothetical protein